MDAVAKDRKAAAPHAQANTQQTPTTQPTSTMLIPATTPQQLIYDYCMFQRGHMSPSFAYTFLLDHGFEMPFSAAFVRPMPHGQAFNNT